MLEVRLTDVRVEQQSNTPVVLLEETGGRRSLPIFIGAPEATAIAFALQGIEVPRPMTHDLMRELIEVLGARLVRVVVTDVRDQTYFAELHLQVGERLLTHSCRPSDAIALAARMQSPLFVEDELMSSAGIVLDAAGEEGGEENSEEIVGEFLHFLDNVRPEDFSG